APALQWVRTVAPSSTSAAPCAPRLRLAATSSSWMASASRSSSVRRVSGERLRLRTKTRRMRSIAQKRLTAVGRVAAKLRHRRETLDPAPGAPLSSAPVVSDFSQSYSVEIAGSLEDCFVVLTDFEAYPSWSGPVTECRVLERHPDGLPMRVAFSLDMTLKTIRY